LPQLCRQLSARVSRGATTSQASMRVYDCTSWRRWGARQSVQGRLGHRDGFMSGHGRWWRHEGHGRRRWLFPRRSPLRA